jgi:hypothetical protein
VNEWSEEEIARILWEYGDERRSRFIAKMIVDGRPIRTTGALATVVRRSLPPGPQKEKYKCLSRVFQVGEYSKCNTRPIDVVCVLLFYFGLFLRCKRKKRDNNDYNVICYFILFIHLSIHTHVKHARRPCGSL